MTEPDTTVLCIGCATEEEIQARETDPATRFYVCERHMDIINDMFHRS